MRTRSGKSYGYLSWLRSGTSRSITGDLDHTRIIAKSRSKTTTNATPVPLRRRPIPPPSSASADRPHRTIDDDDGDADGPSLSLAPRAIATIVPSVSFRPDGTFTPCLGRATWTLERETPRARVYAGKNWSVRPWDDDSPERRGFVARFRWAGETHVVHLSDDGATVAFLIECLDEIVPLTVTGIASRACGVMDGATTLRELAARERRAYTVDDVGEIVVFARR